jgi:predicted nucleic acid-binding protein
VSLLVDTSILVDVLRGSDAAVVALEDAAVLGPLQSSVVVRAEIMAGLRPAEEERTRDLLAVLTWHPVTLDIADEAGRLGRRWLRSHNGIDTADLLIAATASGLSLGVLTKNVKHFPMFPGLRPPY